MTAFELFAAVNDAYTIDEGRTLHVAAPGVLSNDANPSGGALDAERVTAPAHGTLTLRSDGSFTYVPNAGFSGADSFTYHARSGVATSSVATAAITVLPLPIVNPDSYATDQDTALPVNAATGVLANDTSGTGDPLIALMIIGPANGTLTGRLAADGSFTYTPDPGFFGSDTFAYRAYDGANVSALTTVTITVNEVLPPAVPPTAVNDSYSTDQDTPLTATAATGGRAGQRHRQRAETAGGASDPPHGAVTVSADGSFTYTPDAGFFGPDSFTYEAANAAGTDTATVTITVNEVLPPAVPPTAADDTYATVENTSLSATVATGVLANDTGTSPLTAGGASDPPDGAVTLSADGSFTYTPDAGFTGTDTFTYDAANGAGTDTATVTITVNPAPPVVSRRQRSTTLQHRSGHALTATVATGVLANDTGTSPLTAGGASDPPDGAVTLSADGSFTYTPDAGFTGTDTFTYDAANGAGTDTATVTITVNEVLPPAVPPTAVDDSYATVASTSLTTTVATGVLANDIGSQPMTAGGASDPPSGSVTSTSTGRSRTPRPRASRAQTRSPTRSPTWPASTPRP